ncbi:MAG: hypothetical protein K0S51_510 [Bacillales bacterium]|jgi:uncharacterized protein YlaI|nr:hypothetical protein [Bacillales bacterium]
MKAKCVICEQIEILDDDSALAKRLRNRPVHTYLCNECDERIKQKTLKRLETGKFITNRGIKVKNDLD